MGIITNFLKLFKYDDSDLDEYFSIESALNDNWDKIDIQAKEISNRVGILEIDNTINKEDIEENAQKIVDLNNKVDNINLDGLDVIGVAEGSNITIDDFSYKDYFNNFIKTDVILDVHAYAQSESRDPRPNNCVPVELIKETDIYVNGVKASGLTLKGDQYFLIKLDNEHENYVNSACKFIKQVYKITLNGTENWEKVSNKQCFRLDINRGLNATTKNKILSNYFKFSENEEISGIGYTEGDYLYLYTEHSNVADFKNWLVEKSTTTPVEIYYYTATTTETLLERIEKYVNFFDNIKGTSNITSTANLKIKYLKNNFLDVYETLKRSIFKEDNFTDLEEKVAQNETDITRIKNVLLYKNTSGTSGTVTLSQNATLFEELVITCWRRNGGYFTVTVRVLDGKEVYLSNVYPASDTMLQLNGKKIKIVGNTITVVTEGYANITHNAPNAVGEQEAIFITEVVGRYKK